jgi:hypothetical protein
VYRKEFSVDGAAGTDLLMDLGEGASRFRFLIRNWPGGSLTRSTR